MTPRPTRSPNRTRPAAAVKIGAEVTRTTLAATVVRASEEIHVAKCNARNTPDSSVTPSCRRDRPRISPGCRMIAAGSRMAAAIAFR